MTNMPKDLDQSDYERDGREAHDAYIEHRISELGEHHDGVDLINACAMICDAFFSGDVDDFMRSAFLHDLIQFSQSNPNGVHAQIDEAMHLLFD